MASGDKASRSSRPSNPPAAIPGSVLQPEMDSGRSLGSSVASVAWLYAWRVSEMWEPTSAGILRLPSGRLVRDRGLRVGLPVGPGPQFGFYLLAGEPPAVGWESRWVPPAGREADRRTGRCHGYRPRAASGDQTQDDDYDQVGRAHPPLQESPSPLTGPQGVSAGARTALATEVLTGSDPSHETSPRTSKPGPLLARACYRTPVRMGSHHVGRGSI